MHAGIAGVRLPPGAEVEQAVATLRLLADPTRLRIVAVLAQGGASVGRLATMIRTSQPAASQHLAKLRLAGAVRAERRGAFVFYELADPTIGALVSGLLRTADR